MIHCTDFPQSPGIYCITNLKNKKMYIGSAANLYSRINKHISSLSMGNHKNRHMQSSYNKHGDVFAASILEHVEKIENLLGREQWWIDNVKCEYNKAKIAGGCHGVRCSLEKKRKIAKAVSRSWIGDERRKEKLRKISNSPKERKRRSELMKERWADPNYREFMRSKLSERKITDSMRENMSKSQKKRFEDPEQLRNNRENAKLGAKIRWTK